MSTNREVTQQTDDTRLVRETLTDGSKVWNVEVLLEDGAVITMGFDGATSARSAYGLISHASFVSHDDAPAAIARGKVQS